MEATERKLRDLPDQHQMISLVYESMVVVVKQNHCLFDIQKNTADMNSGLMLQRYGLKSGVLCKCWLDSLTELPVLKISKKT